MRAVSLKTKLITTRVEETRDWYIDLLGMTVLEQWDEPGDRGCILGLADSPGEALLEIFHGEKDFDFGGLSLQFRVPDVDAVRPPDDPRFRCRGPVDRPWGSRYLFFTDPNGVVVVLFSGTSL